MKTAAESVVRRHLIFSFWEGRVSDADDADMLLTFWFTSRDWARDERTLPRGVAARGAGAEKVKVSTLLSLCNKDSHNVDTGFY